MLDVSTQRLRATLTVGLKGFYYIFDLGGNYQLSKQIQRMDSRSESRGSSFEALNHDPNLSRLAKEMFQKTHDYLNFEVIFGFLL